MSACRECRGSVTVEKNATIRYKIGGLPHVELRGVVIERCQQCKGESTGIPRIGQLHRVLAEHFVQQSRMLAPDEVRFLRKHIGLSSTDLADRMGVTRETVSRWETGAQPMGPVADRLLRFLVANHEPTDNYEIDEVLKVLTDKPAPKRLAPVTVQNSPDGGWRSREMVGA